MAATAGAGADGFDAGNLTHCLYTRYGSQIYAYCLHRLGSREEAEDAVQTTFMNVFRALQRGTETHAEQAWLYQIAQNVCLARRSATDKRLRRETPNDLEVLQEIVPSPRRDRREELIGLEDVLEAMPENQRRAILMREWQGLSYREIGQGLGLSQASVEMLIFRARRALAKGLEQRPAEQRASRLRRATGTSFELGGVVAGAKSLLTASMLVKAAVLATAAGTVTYAVGKPAEHTIVHRPVRAQVVRVAASARSRAPGPARPGTPASRARRRPARR